MTAREARNRRRAEERREVKLARKAVNSPNAQSTANRSVETIPAFNPEIENEFPRELQVEANLVRNRIHCNIGLNPPHGSRVETNRLNAQHSTGPKSPQGKLASSRNSLKHGLASGTIVVPGEDPAAFESLLHDLLEEHQPANTTEDLLIHEMAQSHWLAQRALRFQNECFTEEGVDEKRLSLFLRYQTTHNRAFHKPLATLLKLKKERGVPSGSGFVSQSIAPGHATEPRRVSERHDEAAVRDEPASLSEAKTQADEAAILSEPKIQADAAASLSEPKIQADAAASLSEAKTQADEAA